MQRYHNDKPQHRFHHPSLGNHPQWTVGSRHPWLQTSRRSCGRQIKREFQRIFMLNLKFTDGEKNKQKEDTKSPPVLFVREEESLPRVPDVHGGVHLPHCFGEPQFVDVLGVAVHQVVSVQSPHPDPCPNAEQRSSLEHHTHTKKNTQAKQKQLRNVTHR